MEEHETDVVNAMLAVTNRIPTWLVSRELLTEMYMTRDIEMGGDMKEQMQELGNRLTEFYFQSEFESPKELKLHMSTFRRHYADSFIRSLCWYESFHLGMLVQQTVDGRFVPVQIRC